MFSLLKKLFSGIGLLEEAYNDTVKMLADSFQMFKESVRSLRHSDNADLEIDLYEADKTINHYMREVRRKVLSHLAIAQPADAAAALILVSVVIDVERIADYTKNIYELASAHPKRLIGGDFEADLDKFEKLVSDWFEKVSQAYSQRDVESAEKLIGEERALSKWCDSAVHRLITNPPSELSAGEAAALTLYVRYLKRIASHLINVASTVVKPFPQIGFKGKKADEETDQ